MQENENVNVSDAADIESIDNEQTETMEIEDWKSKCKELQQALDEKNLEIETINKQHKIDLALKDCNAKDIDVLRKLIDFEKINLLEDELQGFNEQIDFLKEKYNYLFQEEVPKTEPFFYKPQRSLETKDISGFEFAKDTTKPWNSK